MIWVWKFTTPQILWHPMVHHVPENAWGISPIQKKHTNNVIFMTPLGHGHCHHFKNLHVPRLEHRQQSTWNDRAPFHGETQGFFRQEFDNFPSNSVCSGILQLATFDSPFFYLEHPSLNGGLTITPIQITARILQGSSYSANLTYPAKNKFLAGERR